MTTLRTQDDLNDFSYIHAFHPSPDGTPRTPDSCREPSPNTAALLGPAGCLTPAQVSRTKDGRTRVMDLNNLGLSRGAPQRQHTPSREALPASTRKDVVTLGGQSKRPQDFARYGRVSAFQSGPTLSPQAVTWRQEQRQRAEDAARARANQAYVSDARGTAFLQPDPEMVGPPSSLSTSSKAYVYMGEARPGIQIRQKLEEAQRQQDRQRVRQEMFRAVPPPQSHPTCPERPHQIPRQPNNFVELTEAELDEKRRQLLTKKARGTKEASNGKTKKNKKYRNEPVDSGGQDTGKMFVPHRPSAPAKDKQNDSGGYSKRKRRLIGKAQPDSITAYSVNNTDEEIGQGHAPSVANVEYHYRYYGPAEWVSKQDDCSTVATFSRETGHVPCAHPPLIDSQKSQQNVSWNSDTAKRGLGFRSKQRREAGKGMDIGSGEGNHGNMATEICTRRKRTVC